MFFPRDDIETMHSALDCRINSGALLWLLLQTSATFIHKWEFLGRVNRKSGDENLDCCQ